MSIAHMTLIPRLLTSELRYINVICTMFDQHEPTSYGSFWQLAKSYPTVNQNSGSNRGRDHIHLGGVNLGRKYGIVKQREPTIVVALSAVQEKALSKTTFNPWNRCSPPVDLAPFQSLLLHCGRSGGGGSSSRVCSPITDYQSIPTDVSIQLFYSEWPGQ